MTKHYCDRCAKEMTYPLPGIRHTLDDNRCAVSVSVVSTWPAPPFDPASARRQSLAEICPDCHKALLIWLKRGDAA